MVNELIVAKKVSVGYGNRIIWKDASFTISSGEFIGLLGANGVGKTTLFKLLLGLETPISGDLKVFDDKPKKGSPRIGYFPQRRLLDGESRINAIEYVRLGISGNKLGFALSKAGKAEISESLKALKLVDAENFAYRPLSELSGGEAQRVFLAQALVSKPEILLLDEPLANLDIKREIQLIRLVSKIAQTQNIAVLLIAHDINPLLPVVDRIIYIANSKVASGKPSEIITSEKLSELYNAPIEVLKGSRGQLAVLGVEEAVHHDR